MVTRAIFISYRRDDSEGEAGRLYDDLVRAYGDPSVFMDVSGIDPGTDFRKAIDKNVSSCGVLLAVIGPAWTRVTGASGGRRLDDANDFVRLEIASALSRDVPVIPVLVHDAKMPHPDDLPENLKDLAYRNSVELTHARWNSDVTLLVKALAGYVQSSGAKDETPVHATVPVQLPPPHTAVSRPRKALSKASWAAGALAGAVVVAAATLLIAHGIYRRNHAQRQNIQPEYLVASGAPAPAPAKPAPTGPAAVEPAAGPAAGKGTPDATLAARSASAAAAAGATPATSPGTNGADLPPAALAMVGQWEGSSSHHPAFVRFDVLEGPGPSLLIRAFSNCRKGVCELGTRKATMDGPDAVASWNVSEDLLPGDKARLSTIKATLSGKDLVVEVNNDVSGGAKESFYRTFTRASDASEPSSQPSEVKQVAVTPAPAPPIAIPAPVPYTAPASFGSAAFPQAALPLLGQWTTPAGSAHGLIVELDVTKGPGQWLLIRALGSCQQGKCGWGTAKGAFDGKEVVASWEVPAQEPGDVAHLTTIEATPAGSRLAVRVRNKFADGRTTSGKWVFVPAPAR